MAASVDVIPQVREPAVEFEESDLFELAESVRTFLDRTDFDIVMTAMPVLVIEVPTEAMVRSLHAAIVSGIPKDRLDQYFYSAVRDPVTKRMTIRIEPLAGIGIAIQNSCNSVETQQRSILDGL